MVKVISKFIKFISEDLDFIKIQYYITSNATVMVSKLLLVVSSLINYFNYLLSLLL